MVGRTAQYLPMEVPFDPTRDTQFKLYVHQLDQGWVTIKDATIIFVQT